jgi:hypothetical protein
MDAKEQFVMCNRDRCERKRDILARACSRAPRRPSSIVDRLISAATRKIGHTLTCSTRRVRSQLPNDNRTASIDDPESYARL